MFNFKFLKKMKSIKHIIIIFFFLLISCDTDKYLDIYPLTEVTEGNYYSTSLQVEQALNDVYRQLGRVYSAHGLSDLFGEQASDNTHIIIKSGADNFSEQINNYEILTDNGRVKTAWDTNYNSIYICNNILEKMEQVDFVIDEKLKNRMTGEALLIRSLIYFNMVRVWGNIPLITKPISPLEAYDFLRESEDKIYQQIINDLNYAKQNLPGEYSGENVGRLTKYSASGILAKVYMTLDDKVNTKSELEFIINSNRFSLDSNNDGVVDFNDFAYIFHPSTKNCKSSILEVQYLNGSNAFNSNHQNVYTPFSHAFNLVDLGVPGSIFRGEGINTPTSDLLDEFEDADPRMDASIYPGFTNQATGEFVTYPFTIKYFDPNWTNPGNNISVIRYADILLMYAELTGDPEGLNLVRDRVGLPAYDTEGYPSDKYPSLVMAIEHERRIELCFEFHRFFDLKRTGRAIEILRKKGFDISEDKLVFPIPQNAIDVNPRLTQNAGY